MNEGFAKADFYIMNQAARLTAIEICLYALAKTSPDPAGLIQELDNLYAEILGSLDLPEDYASRVQDSIKLVKNFAGINVPGYSP